MRKREADEIEFSKRNNIEIQDDDEVEEAVRDRQSEQQTIQSKSDSRPAPVSNVENDVNLLDMDISSPQVNPSQSVQNHPNPSTSNNLHSDDFDFFDSPVQTPTQTTQPIVQASVNKQAKIFDNDDFDIMDIDFSKPAQPKADGDANKPKTKLNIFDTKTLQSSKKQMEFIFYDLDPSEFQSEWLNFENQSIN